MQLLNRNTYDVQQGSGDWLRLRESFDTASEAPAALGVGKYVTRAELLRQKYTGLAAEHSAATLGKFEAGHAAEARARPMAETFIDAELYPVTMSVEVDGLKLLASLDGQTMDDAIIWETKLWNEELAADVRAGTLAEHYLVQMDQELLVSGAERCLFTVTDGTPERFVSCWHHPSQKRFDALIDGWKRFHADLAAYELPPAAPAAPVGKAPETLPALNIEVVGTVTRTNLNQFKTVALTAIRSVNRDLQTDQHFADAEKAVKWCGEVESRLKAAKEHALSQTADIDALFRALDDIGAEAKAVRLDLDKLVTRRKQEVKEEVVDGAKRELSKHLADLEAEIRPHRLPVIAADFAGAVKGLRSIDSLRDKVASVLLTAKTAADLEARVIRANVAAFQSLALAQDLGFLFPDLSQLVVKAADDFGSAVRSRVAQHREAEAARREREAEAARAAEAKRQQEAAAAEAARLADQQRQQAAAQAEAQRQADAALQTAQSRATPAPAPAVAVQACRPGDRAMLASPAGAELVGKAAAALADEPATLKLGTICERLGVTMTAAFLADVLRIKPAKTDGRDVLFRESQFPLICHQLQSHVGAMAELYSGAVTA